MEFILAMHPGLNRERLLTVVERARFILSAMQEMDDAWIAGLEGVVGAEQPVAHKLPLLAMARRAVAEGARTAAIVQSVR